MLQQKSPYKYVLVISHHRMNMENKLKIRYMLNGAGQNIPHSIYPTFLCFPYSTLTLPLLLARLLVPY
jgi:hypothetical protein